MSDKQKHTLKAYGSTVSLIEHSWWKGPGPGTFFSSPRKTWNGRFESGRAYLSEFVGRWQLKSTHQKQLSVHVGCMMYIAFRSGDNVTVFHWQHAHSDRPSRLQLLVSAITHPQRHSNYARAHKFISNHMRSKENAWCSGDLKFPSYSVRRPSVQLQTNQHTYPQTRIEIEGACNSIKDCKPSSPLMPKQTQEL